MRERLTNLRFLALGCAAAVAAMAAARVSHAPTDEAVPLSRGEDVFLPDDRRFIEGTVPARSHLAGILSAHGLDDAAAGRVIEAVRPAFDPRRIRSGNTYRLVVGGDGTLRSFEYDVDSDRFLQVNAPVGGDGTLSADLVHYVKEHAEVAIRGFIDGPHTSLVSALNGAGENVALAVEMAEVFGGEIDFNTEVRRGDRFDVLFEKYYRDDEFAGYGDVLAAEFVNAGRRVQAFRFTLPGDDDALYYDEQGRSLRRQFLRSPFRFEPRVTSRFSKRRLHPVLGVYRPHLGVDYGAPTGTPVVAVAAGAVVSAGRSGGSGNMVRLRHTNGYETYYLHLSAFADGIRPGARVAQGQTIGRVGATGLATGPHLDYRMRRDGVFVDPLIEHRKLPPGDPVPERHLAAFHEVRSQALRRMSSAIAPGGRSALLAQ